MRDESASSNVSRTTALAITMPVEPASPMTNRAAIRASIERAKAHARRSDGKGGRTVKERLPPADAVGYRSADELTDGQSGQEQRQRKLHRPTACLQILLDMRERRQVHVDAERTERVEQTKEDNESKTWVRGGKFPV